MTVSSDAGSTVDSDRKVMTLEPKKMLRAAVAVLGAALAVPALAQDTVTGIRGAGAISDEQLAKKLANPVAALISVPFQLNYDQGGFGSVWGSKNLKAISVIGTGSIKVANAQALLQARQALKTKYITSYEHPDFRQWSRIGGLAKPIVQVPIPTEDRRPQACQGCVNGCRSRSNLGYGNESACQETSWYNEFLRARQALQEPGGRARDLCGLPHSLREPAGNALPVRVRDAVDQGCGRDTRCDCQDSRRNLGPGEVGGRKTSPGSGGPCMV